MLPQLQPNNWSCLVTSFAIVLDCTVDSLIKEIGHDGSAIEFSNKPEPFNRRAFHPQEIIDVCLFLNPRRYIITIDSDPTFHPNDFRNIIHLYSENYNKKRVHNYLQEFNCVLTGKTLRMQRHAVAWDHIEQKIIDPRNKITKLQEFIIEDLYLVIPSIILPKQTKIKSRK